ncbi:hypothetical protein SteCoe_29221 [Stentor coeruleus]|uniref:Uncharacterized protein n=1 Tax=Stentor coeruleus TaxID=5963 RepID=A0A1R2B6C8_9CILI|nr:hypothetical protein SteCoe_29221 [Stentor coeruleus]
MLRILRRFFANPFNPRGGQGGQRKNPSQRIASLAMLKDESLFTENSNYNELLSKFFDYCKAIWSGKEKLQETPSYDLQKTLSNWSKSIPFLNASQVAKLSKILGILRVKDENLWTKIEKHVQRKVFKDLSPKDISELAKSSLECNRTSDAFWNTLENTIITRVYPTKRFEASELTDLLISLIELNKGNIELNKPLNDNLADCAGDLTIKDIIRLIFLFNKQGFVEDRVLKNISKRCVELKSELDGTKLQQIIIFFIKNFVDPEYITAIEEEILSKINIMTLNNLSMITLHYAKYYSESTHKSKHKNEIFIAIEKFMAKNKDSLVENHKGTLLPEEALLRVMWSLSTSDNMGSMRLWKNYAYELDKKPSLMKIDNAFMVRDLKHKLAVLGLY